MDLDGSMVDWAAEVLEAGVEGGEVVEIEVNGVTFLWHSFELEKGYYKKCSFSMGLNNGRIVGVVQLYLIL